jgi:hypothetical protein
MMRAVLRRTVDCVSDPLYADLAILFLDLSANKSTAMKTRSNSTRRYSTKWIKYELITLGECEDKAFGKTDGKLTRMGGLLSVICLYIWNVPYVLWIFAKRITT